MKVRPYPRSRRNGLARTACSCLDLVDGGGGAIDDDDARMDGVALPPESGSGSGLESASECDSEEIPVGTFNGIQNKSGNRNENGDGLPRKNPKTNSKKARAAKGTTQSQTKTKTKTKTGGPRVRVGARAELGPRADLEATTAATEERKEYTHTHTHTHTPQDPITDADARLGSPSDAPREKGKSSSVHLDLRSRVDGETANLTE
jgi:hypothetical protein